MTFQISKSQVDGLPYNFADEVEKYQQAMLAHRFSGDAAPVAPGIIEAAVRRVQYPIEDGKPDDFVIDFEIVDDTPPPPEPPTPTERRTKLMFQVQAAQADAAAKVISPARARLLSMDVSRVYAKATEARTPADDAALAQHAAIQARLNALTYHTATLEVEIEDLADDKLDSWQMTPFPAV
ncbi:hypothetical protein [Tardiphaga sp. 803_E3_N1_3]|uniref:hypothetical protein n=1 Tax=Tardiphaga sp. 803_E3_N1_3 TaxID=3240785 RepID=UPI003F219EE2